MGIYPIFCLHQYHHDSLAIINNPIAAHAYNPCYAVRESLIDKSGISEKGISNIDGRNP